MKTNISADKAVQFVPVFRGDRETTTKASILTAQIDHPGPLLLLVQGPKPESSFGIMTYRAWQDTSKLDTKAFMFKPLPNFKRYEIKLLKLLFLMDKERLFLGPISLILDPHLKQWQVVVKEGEQDVLTHRDVIDKLMLFKIIIT